jgi:hypothetical protein
MKQRRDGCLKRCSRYPDRHPLASVVTTFLSCELFVKKSCRYGSSTCSHCFAFPANQFREAEIAHCCDHNTPIQYLLPVPLYPTRNRSRCRTGPAARRDHHQFVPRRLSIGPQRNCKNARTRQQLYLSAIQTRPGSWRSVRSDTITTCWTADLLRKPSRKGTSCL